jgi:FAD/FMN-containing dehydrogenase
VHASTAAMPAVHLRVLGGAVARVPTDATAFAHRKRPIMVVVAAVYERPEEAAEQQAWVAALARALHDGSEGAYVNFLDDTGEARVSEAYPGSSWDRLVAIKTTYDPHNLFRSNHNIPPAAQDLSARRSAMPMSK